ncbi:MAG: hypothetical protein K9G72_20020 [Rhodobacteraceae bacterium]|nr:hypothetical protein [Paracoccaceae bacterium]
MGGNGDDVIVATDTDQIVDGGQGTDTVQYGAAVSAANLLEADLVRVEIVEITNTANASYDFSAQTEALTILGNTGNDLIIGGLADDSISGGNGDDLFEGVDNGDTIDGGNNSDAVELYGDYAPVADENLVNVEEVNVQTSNGTLVDLHNQTETLVIVGNAGDDTLIGGSADDTFLGEAGADLIDLSAGGNDLIGYVGGFVTTTSFNQHSGFEIVDGVVVRNNVDTIKDFDTTGVWTGGSDYSTGGVYAGADIIHLEYRSNDMQVTQIQQVVAAANEQDALKNISDLLGGASSSLLRENYTDAVVVKVVANNEAAPDADFGGYYMIINTDLNSGFDAGNDMVLHFVWSNDELRDANLLNLDENIFFWDTTTEPDAWVAPVGGVTVRTHDGSLSDPINGVSNVDELGRTQIFGNQSGSDMIDATNEAVNHVTFDFGSGQLSGASDTGVVNANTVKYVNFDGFKAGGAGSTVTLSSGAESVWGGDGNDTIVMSSSVLSGEFSNANGNIESLEVIGEGNDIVGLNSGSVTQVEDVTMISVAGQSSLRLTETQLDDLNTHIRADGAQDKIIVATGDLSTLTVDAPVEHFVVEDAILGDDAVSVTIATRSTNVTVEALSADDVITVDASGLAGSATLTLLGSAGAKFIVQNLVGSLDASQLLSGPVGEGTDSRIDYALEISTGDAFGPIVITTGPSNTLITTPSVFVNGDPATDSITVEAGALVDSAVLKLDGGANVVVNNVDASVNILAGGGTLTGTLEVNVLDDASADSVYVQTGTNDTTVNALDSDDSIVVDAIKMEDDTGLVLTGAADHTVNDLVANVTSTATGNVIVNLNDDVVGENGTTVSISGAANDGVVNTGDFDGNDTVVLAGTDTITVNVENTTNIETGSASSNFVISAAETASIDASATADSMDINLFGDGDAVVVGVDANYINIVGDNADAVFAGDLSITSGDGVSGEFREVFAGSGNLTITSNDTVGYGDDWEIFADEILTDKTITLNGSNYWEVRDLSADLTINGRPSGNQGGLDFAGGTVYLQDDGASESVTLTVNDATVSDVTVRVESFGLDDNLILQGDGAVKLMAQSGDQVNVKGSDSANLTLIVQNYDPADQTTGVVLDASVMSDGLFVEVQDRSSAISANKYVTINGVQSSLTIDATPSTVTTGNVAIVINTVDEAVGTQADTIDFFTNLVGATVNANDSDDFVYVDAYRMGDAETLVLTGSSTLEVDALSGDVDAAATTGTLGIMTKDNGSDDTINITTGSNRTSVYGSGSNDTITVDADVMLDTTATSPSWVGGELRVYGASHYVVNDVEADVNAFNLTGTLDVNVKDVSDDQIDINTGLAATTISGADGSDFIYVTADQMANNETLTLNGLAEVSIDGIVADVDASNLDGDLFVYVTDNGDDNGVSIQTGSADTTVDGASATDTITVDATEMLDFRTLTLDGLASVIVNHANESITVDGKTLSLNGSLTITSDDDSVDGSGDALTVLTGTSDTTVTANDADDTVNVDASVMSENSGTPDSVLTLDGAADFTVTGLLGDLDAKTGDLAGTLDITTANALDNEIDIDLGSAASTVDGVGANDTITIDATNLDNDKALTLDGASAVVVNALVGDIDAKAGDLAGTLNVTTVDNGVDNDISISTGSAATTVDGAGATDTITIDATNLDNDTALTLDGASAVVVNALVGDIDAKTGDLAGTLNVTTADNGVDNDISISTGSAATTVDGAGATDTITVDATNLDNDTALTLDGASAVVVNALVGDIDAKTGDLAGTLNVTTADNGVDNDISISTGSAATTVDGAGATDTITIDATNLDNDTALTLDGASAVVVNALVGDIDAKTGNLAGTLNVTTADAADDDISIDLGGFYSTINGTDASDTINIDAAATVDGVTLELNGASDIVVTNADSQFLIDAGWYNGKSALTGTLNITANDDVSVVRDVLDVYTGTADTTVNAYDGDDLIDVNGAAMADGSTLTLTGVAEFLVNSVDESVTVDASGLDGYIEVYFGYPRDPNGADTLTLLTGTDNIYVEAGDTDDSMIIDAGALAAGKTLSLDGAADVVVNNVLNNVTIDGSNVWDLLTVNIPSALSSGGSANDTTVAVVAGRTDTTVNTGLATSTANVDASRMANGSTLTLTGASAVNVSNANGSITIDASSTLTGELNITANSDGNPSGDTLTVLTGTSNTTVTANDADDIVIVEADEMLVEETLILVGAAATTVNDVQSGIVINGVAMTDTLVVNIIDETVGTLADTINVGASQTHTTVNAADADDTVNIDALDMEDGHVLTITGQSNVFVSRLVGDVAAGSLSGDLQVTIANFGTEANIVSGSGDDTVYGSNSGDLLTLTSVETVESNGGNDYITMTDSSLKYANLGEGGDELILSLPTTATILGGGGTDYIYGSSGDDSLTLTTVEWVYADLGNDTIVITDSDADTILLGSENDTLTFQDGSALTVNTVVDGGSNTEFGQDVVNVNVDDDLNMTLGGLFENVELVNLVDQGTAGFDTTITLNTAFDNNGLIIFDANSFDAGEVLSFDGTDYRATHALGVIGGAGDDVLYSSDVGTSRGKMTFDLSHGGVDTVHIQTVAWASTAGSTTATVNLTQSFLSDFQSAPTTEAVQIYGFTGGEGGDVLDIHYGDVSGLITTTPGFDGTSSGGMVNNVTLNVDVGLSSASSGDVIEISSEAYNLNAGWTIGQVAGQLSRQGNGDALFGLNDGVYTVAIYSNQVTSGENAADVHLFNIRVDGGDGFDLSWTDTQGPDYDMIEYVGMLHNVGADMLDGTNFI